jgi:hypothetical protein
MVVKFWGVCLLGKISSFEIFQNKFFSVENRHKIESLQLKFFRRVLGVHSKSIYKSSSKNDERAVLEPLS